MRDTVTNRMTCVGDPLQVKQWKVCFIFPFVADGGEASVEFMRSNIHVLSKVMDTHPRHF